MNEFTLVRAAVLVKDGKTEYCYEEADIRYYIDVLDYTLIGWEDIYVQKTGEMEAWE